MKKLLVCVLALCLMLSICACGGEKEDAPAEQTKAGSVVEATEEVVEEKPQASSSAITLEDVMNHPVTPVEDFEYGITAEEEVEIYDYIGTDEIIVIPDTIEGKPVVTMVPYAFGVNSTIRGIRLSDNVRLVDEGVFGANSYLEVFVSGTGLKEVAMYSFQNCPKLHTVVFREGLETIRNTAFPGCPELKEIDIPDSVTTMEPFIAIERTEDLVLVGSEGSLAQEYAAAEGLGFRVR